MSSSTSVMLTTAERTHLRRAVRSGAGRADVARRARLILLLADQTSYARITAMTGCSSRTIARVKRRFLATRLESLRGRHRGSPRRVLTPRLEAKILRWTIRPPTDGTTHWSTRRLARALGLQHTLVATAWRRAGLAPHRLRRYMRSTDPDFEQKAADVIGLYIDPPQHAAVFCVDEKTAIQALDRRDPRLPLSPGRAERHGFEYVRHGTLSLYAALDTQTGLVVGQTAARHTSKAFVAFLDTVVTAHPAQREIHIIADNLSAHKTAQVTDFLDAHPHVTLHFTPTYSSWLNQVELWFSKVTRDVIAHGIFTSVADLARKLRRYIRHYNTTAQPVRWTYTNPTRRIA